LSTTYGSIMNGADIRRARKRLNMTQAELAKALGMERNSITRMEIGNRPVMRTTELAVKYLLLTMKKTKGRK
jgi:transcriptional regulator with XRE-family HTH domain